MADDITPRPEWTPIPGWDNRTRNSGLEMNRQGEALANRIELVRDNQTRTPLSYATLVEAEAAAATLPDGQIVDALDVQERYKVQDGMLALKGSIDQLRLDLNDSSKGAKLIQSAAQYLPMVSRLQQDVNNGLQITPFHFISGSISNTSAVNNQVAIQEAVNFVFTGFQTPLVLDFCGRNWRIDSPIVFAAQPANSALRNGRITCTEAFPSNAPLFDFRQPTVGPAGTGTRINILDMAFNGGGNLPSQNYAAGAIWLNNTHGVRVDRSAFQYFNSHVVWDQTNREATEVVVSNSRFNGRRLGDAIRLSGDDGEVLNCMIAGHANGLTLLAGSTGVIGNHIYDCNTAVLDNGGGAIYVGNYIDQCPIRLRALGGPTLLTGNKFLATSIADLPEMAFIVAEPQIANAGLYAFTMTANTFNHPFHAIKETGVNTTNGSIGSVSNVFVDGNISVGTGGGFAQSSRPRRAVQVTSGTGLTASVDMTDRTVFNLPLTRVKASFQRSSTGTSQPVITPLDPVGMTASAALSVAGTGRILFDCDVNDVYQ